MGVWIVRTGFTKVTISQAVICTGWDLDASTATTYDELETLCREKWPDGRRGKGASRNTQIWDFCRRLQTGDLVIMPRDWDETFSLGRITGSFQYRSDLPRGARMTRPVDWLAVSIASSKLPDDIQRSLQSNLAVRQVHRESSIAAVVALVDEGVDEPLQSRVHFSVAEDVASGLAPHENALPVSAPASIEGNLEHEAHNQICRAIRVAFPGSDLIRLLEGLLVAQGYLTDRLLSDARFGIGLIAHRQHTIHESQRVYVRVIDPLSSQSGDAGKMASAKDICDFRDAMNSLGVAHGMLVSWLGFCQEATEIARRTPAMRLRTATDIVNAVLSNYEGLPEGLHAELPLQRIWIPAPRESSE